ncbi:MAG: hypothetical protein ACJAUG_003074 [Halioglobus sp.]|jgi:hypothetical protein
MAENDYAEAAFLEFLRQGNIARLIKPATARSRKLAVEDLFG